MDFSAVLDESQSSKALKYVLNFKQIALIDLKIVASHLVKVKPLGKCFAGLQPKSPILQSDKHP